MLKVLVFVVLYVFFFLWVMDEGMEAYAAAARLGSGFFLVI